VLLWEETACSKVDTKGKLSDVVMLSEVKKMKGKGFFLRNWQICFVIDFYFVSSFCICIELYSPYAYATFRFKDIARRKAQIAGTENKDKIHSIRDPEHLLVSYFGLWCAPLFLLFSF
jgi:hypothetical protein